MQIKVKNSLEQSQSVLNMLWYVIIMTQLAFCFSTLKTSAERINIKDGFNALTI